jgi:hypothetical protein
LRPTSHHCNSARYIDSFAFIAGQVRQCGFDLFGNDNCQVAITSAGQLNSSSATGAILDMRYSFANTGLVASDKAATNNLSFIFWPPSLTPSTRNWTRLLSTTMIASSIAECR